MKYRLKINDLRIMIVLLLLVIMMLFNPQSLIINQNVLAQEPATQSSSLLQKIDSIKTEIASKAAALKNEVSQKMSNKALLGQIKLIDSVDKTATKITIQAKLNSSQPVLVNEYTIIEGPGSKPDTLKVLDLKDLSSDDVIVALGDLDDRKNLNAKKIVKLEKYAPDSKSVIWGNVESVEGAKITVKKKDGSLVILQTSKETLYKVESDDADISEVAPKRTVIAVGVEKSDKTVETRFIYMAGTLDPAKKELLKSQR